MKSIPDTRDEVEFDWNVGGQKLLVQAKAKVIGGDYYQGPHMTDFEMWVFALDYDGHLIDTASGFMELGVLDFGKDEWNRMESHAETLLFDDFRERRGCA